MREEYRKTSTLLSLFLTGLLFLFYTGCFGGGAVSSKHTIVGVVQKGLFIDGTIRVQEINSTGELITNEREATIDANGTYRLELNQDGLFVLIAKGKFLNEYTGEESSGEVELYTLVDLREKDFSGTININLFTSLEYQRILILMKEGLSYDKALEESKKSMESTFGLSSLVKASDLDIYDLNSTLKKENKNLLLFSATLLKISDENESNESNISKGLEKFSISVMDRMYRDFGKDGKVDDEFKDDFEEIAKDDEVATLARVVQNLGLGDLVVVEDDSPWVVLGGGSESNLTISSFELKSLSLNGTVKNYSGESTAFIGLPHSRSILTFLMQSHADLPIAYSVDIYAVAGSESIEVKSDVAIAENRASTEISIELSTEIKEFLKNAYTNNQEVTFRVLSDVLENRFAYVSKESTIFPKLVELSDKLDVNGTLIDITSATYVAKMSNSCVEEVGSLDDSVVQYAAFNLGVNWKPSDHWSAVDGNVTEGCLKLEYVNSSNILNPTLVESNIQLSSAKSSFSMGDRSVELDLTNDLITMEIKPNGLLIGTSQYGSASMASFKVFLTTKESFHLGSETLGIVALGSNSIDLFSQTMNISSDWDNLELKSIISLVPEYHLYLHSQDLPFYIKLSDENIVLNLEGLHFTNLSANYIHRGEIGQIASNDIQFSNPIGHFNIMINEHGLQTDTPINFGSLRDVKTHFPYTKLTQNGFNLNIVNGEMVPVEIEGEGSYKLAYSSVCQGSSCSDEGTPSQIAYTFPSNKSYISSDGAFMSDVTMENNKIAWGSKQGTKQTFERVRDREGVMYVPGFEVATNDADSLVNHLMGSKDLTTNKQLGENHPLNSDSFNKIGNGLFAGLNVGSLYLKREGENLLTSLDGTSMEIQVGGTTKETLTLNNNAGTKYYIRPSGVTGVFNGALESANAHVYGYPMTFRRFAFAQVANQLKEETWIDGEVSVAEPGGFKVDFSSLALDCTGALKNGLVDESDCEAETPLNCNERLSAWKTKTNFVTVGFESEGSDVCGEKSLRVGHLLDIKALTKPLGLTTTWLKSGQPKNALITGSSANFLDRQEENASSQGFAITLESGSQLTSNGWYKFSGAFGLPFWGMKSVDFGLENSSDGSTRVKSAVMDRDDMNPAWNSATLASEVENRTFMARYQWGSTGLGFELPIRYEAQESEKESIFLGIKKEIDLGVMNANAGINYIKPNDTKISFGASADFEAIGNLNIKIDLNDPESIKKIDATLASPFGITGNPLDGTIGQILRPLHEAEAYADKGLLLGMEELGVLALERGADKVGVDPFEEVSNALVELHALPTRAIVMTETLIAEQIDNRLGVVSNTIASLLENAETINGSEINSSIALLDQVERGFEEMERLKAQLHDINTTLEHLSLTGHWESLDRNISLIIPPTAQCNANHLLETSELFKPIRTLKTNIKKVNDALQGVDINTVRGFASKVEGKIDFDTSDLVDTFEKTQSIAKSLNSEVTSAQTKIDLKLTTFCTEIDGIKEKIRDEVVKVDKFEPIKEKIQEYINVVYALLNSEELTITRTKIAEVQDILEELTLGSISDEQRALLSSFSALSILNQLEDIRINGKSITSLKSDINEQMRGIPQPTADELRHMVINAILDTDAVEAIRIAMNDALSPAMDEVREVAVDLISSVNGVVYDLFDKLSQKANEVLASATSAVASMPIKSGKMDGYALISGDELDRVHIGAEWAVDTGKEDTSYTFNGALDMERWGASGKAGCGGGTSTDGNMDVKISTRDISMKLGGKKLSVDQLYFGFTLANAIPMGIMGGIDSKSGFDFKKFKLYDMKLALGIGMVETYLGAKTAAIFEKYQMQVAFLLGRTCGSEIITSLDPKVGKFITLPNNLFQGAYIRGGASFPIWNNGCALTVGVSADLGAWVVIPGTYGGLIGGGAYGRALCIAALRGQVETIFEKSGENVRFVGTGWGAAGAGWCSPSKWTSVAKSRRDGWCGTGDAQFGASYSNGWNLDTPRTSAVH